MSIKEPGVAFYFAIQHGDEISVHAIGAERTSGYMHFLELTEIDVFPPELRFSKVAPIGIVLEIITPFDAVFTTLTKSVVESIVVHDASGRHVVKVYNNITRRRTIFTEFDAQKAGLTTTRSCRKTQIARSGSIPEFKTEWKGNPIPIPYFYCRTSSMVVYAEFCAPEVTLNSAWNDIVQCAVGAGGVAGIATIIAGPAAALPAFEAAFKACLGAKIGGAVNDISVSLSVQQEPNGDWHRC